MGWVFGAARLPVAFVESREWMKSKTWLAVHRNSSGKLDEPRVPILQIFLEVKLGTEWLKLLKNWLLSISALCKSFVTRAKLEASRAGIEDSFLVSILNNFQNVFTSTAWSCLKNWSFAFLTSETIQFLMKLYWRTAQVFVCLKWGVSSLDSSTDSGVDPRKVPSAGKDLFRNTFANNIQVSGLPILPTLVHIGFIH